MREHVFVFAVLKVVLYQYRKPGLRPASEAAQLTGVAGNRLRAKRAKSSLSHLIILVYKVRSDTISVSTSRPKGRHNARNTFRACVRVRARAFRVCAYVCAGATYFFRLCTNGNLLYFFIVILSIIIH